METGETGETGKLGNWGGHEIAHRTEPVTTMEAALDTARESNGVRLFVAISDAKVVRYPGREDILIAAPRPPVASYIWRGKLDISFIICALPIKKRFAAPECDFEIGQVNVTINNFSVFKKEL